MPQPFQRFIDIQGTEIDNNAGYGNHQYTDYNNRPCHMARFLGQIGVILYFAASDISDIEDLCLYSISF